MVARCTLFRCAARLRRRLRSVQSRLWDGRRSREKKQPQSSQAAVQRSIDRGTRWCQAGGAWPVCRPASTAAPGRGAPRRQVRRSWKQTASAPRPGHPRSTVRPSGSASPIKFIARDVALMVIETRTSSQEVNKLLRPLDGLAHEIKLMCGHDPRRRQSCRKIAGPLQLPQHRRDWRQVVKGDHDRMHLVNRLPSVTGFPSTSSGADRDSASSARVPCSAALRTLSSRCLSSASPPRRAPGRIVALLASITMAVSPRRSSASMLPSTGSPSDPTNEKPTSRYASSGLRAAVRSFVARLSSHLPRCRR